MLWRGSRHIVDRLTVHDVQRSTSSTVARELGIVIESRLTMADHVASVCRSAYYQLWHIRPALYSHWQLMPRRHYNADCRHSSPVAWTTATLFYATSLMTYFNDCSRFKNAAVRLIRGWVGEHTSCKSYDLRRLHWLPLCISNSCFVPLRRYVDSHWDMQFGQ